MSGKGSELGCTFEELAQIYDGVVHNDKLRVCFDTCHVNDSGYDVVHDFDGVIDQFDRLLGKDQISVFHINDSKNPLAARKDRHANIGFGEIGFDALSHIVHHPDFMHVPKILETPYVPHPENPKRHFLLTSTKSKCCAIMCSAQIYNLRSLDCSLRFLFLFIQTNFSYNEKPQATRPAVLHT